MRGLKGKTAIVTGAGSGIGRAIALRLASEGVTVGVFDINPAGAAETAIVSGSRVAFIEEIESAGEPALETVASRLRPADIILVEGYKSANIPKIEATPITR